VNEPSEALPQYRPVVQYDSLESYYTDSAGVITDRPGNQLKRLDGTVLATAGAPDGGGVPALTLAFLQPQSYPGGVPVDPTDYVDETGTHYVTDALAMHARPGYANRVHGRITVQGGVTWLQYWFFMYYDDPQFLGFGTHEGDIEMIQLRLDATGQPDAVTYAQHRSGVRAAWPDVETQAGAPVVYSARGTHASLLRAGTSASHRSLIPDHNDGRGPRVQLTLVTLSPEQTPWAFWPGIWGSTRPRDPDAGKIGIEASSPVALTAHAAWKDPAAFHAAADADDLPPVGTRQTIDAPRPPVPQLEAHPSADGKTVRVRYTIAAGGAAPAGHLVLAVGAVDGTGPPATTVIADPGPSGEVELAAVPARGPLEIRATTHSDRGAVSETQAVPVRV
jgi:hypothetical protein